MATDPQALNAEMAALREWVESMDDDAFERLQQAVAIGRWPDGSRLTEDQRAYAMQAAMLYQAWKGQSDEHLTIGPDGNIVTKPKSVLKTQYRNDDDAIARFDHDDF